MKVRFIFKIHSRGGEDRAALKFSRANIEKLCTQNCTPLKKLCPNQSMLKGFTKIKQEILSLQRNLSAKKYSCQDELNIIPSVLFQKTCHFGAEWHRSSETAFASRSENKRYSFLCSFSIFLIALKKNGFFCEGKKNWTRVFTVYEPFCGRKSDKNLVKATSMLDLNKIKKACV